LWILAGGEGEEEEADDEGRNFAAVIAPTEFAVVLACSSCFLEQEQELLV
jgi:hypothetical protein